MLEHMGITSTATVGVDPNGNGRAERGGRYVKDKIRTYLVTNVRSDLQKMRITDLWTLAAQHGAEDRRRRIYIEGRCEYEFATVVLAKVKEPTDILDPRFRFVLFLGYAPNVSHGYYVFHADGRVELTSNSKFHY